MAGWWAGFIDTYTFNFGNNFTVTFKRSTYESGVISGSKTGTFTGNNSYVERGYPTYISIDNYTLNDGSRLPILTGGTYDADGYFTKST